MNYPYDPLWNALREVNDPEWPISLVDMGLIYGITRHGGRVTVDLTFTAMGCPAMPYILDDVRAKLLEQPGVEHVEINIVWSPPWTADRLSEEGCAEMMLLGVAV
ncbi:MAG: metal-sulfur cluster assembly factor [Ardenticatenaceae bacterium]|nr:metal-sulfur cluster assembly factor [Ardenticatenaceae bacterium]HBY92728.1 benzoyl-CoA oxygenase [Chloroflexota bacterium]